MPATHKIKAVIFDMDGVISDTQKIHSRVEEELLGEYGVHMSAAEITRKFSGVSGREMFSDIFKDAKKNAIEIDEIIEKKWQRMQHLTRGRITSIPGVGELINALRGARIRLSVASASRTEFIEFVLSELGFSNKFDAISSSTEVEKGKPDPAVFFLSAQRLGVRPEECVVIEDGIQGMIGARRAGMKCVGLVPIESKEIYPADLLVKSFADLSVETILSL